MENQALTKESGAEVLHGDYSKTLAAISKVVTHGNLAALTEPQRLQYYTAFCESVGLNPITRPIEFLELGSGKEKKLVLYANKSCAEQLRKIHNISCDKVEHKKDGDLYFVTAHVSDKSGRTDTATAVMPFVEPPTLKKWNDQKKSYDITQNPNAGKPIQPNDFAILIMKTETKAKRRATLSISGLGILDETEIESIPMEKNVTPKEKREAKPEDYKLLNKEKDPLGMATAAQIEEVMVLSEKLQKGDGYIQKILKSRFGHEKIENVSSEFVEGWIKKLQEQIIENEKFLSEMEGKK